jgi:serine/threonine protein kinase/Tfp pilus assembly protein PilF
MGTLCPERWSRIQEVFSRAMDAPDERAREALLDANCASDLELRREVEQLLAAREGADEYIRGVARRSRLPFGESNSESSREGRRIGAYRLIREVGRGGMGAVYLAERADGQFEKRVAIKVLPMWLVGDGPRARFAAERRILARLDHPGIARLLDAGLTEDGVPYFVMEYVEGESITERCDRERCCLEERLALFQQVCEAVDYAHQQRVVHRDLKPSNILVDRAGRVKLLDFGIAKMLDGGAGDEPTLTHWAGQALTPAYASPEQITGLPVGLTSDVYQLGVLLYKLVAGRPPISLAGKTPTEVRRRLTERLPLPPSETVARNGGSDHAEAMARQEELAQLRGSSPEALRAGLRGDLDDIVLKALRKAPERRYASAGDLARDIGRYLAGLPVAARPEPWIRRLGARLPQRYRGLTVGLLAAIVPITAMGVLWWSPWDSPAGVEAESRFIPPAAAERVAVFPFQVRGSGSSEYVGEALASLVAAHLDGTGGVRSIDARTLFKTVAREASDVLDREVIDDLAARFGAGTQLTGDVVLIAGVFQVSARLRTGGDVPRNEVTVIDGSEADLFDVAERLAGWVLGHLAPGRHAVAAAASTRSLSALRQYVGGESAYRRGDHVEAVEAFTRAAETDTSFALANYRLSVALEWVGREADAPLFAARAARHSARLPERDRLLVQGHAAYRHEDFDLAERTYRRLVGLYPETEEGWYGLAEIVFHRGPALGRAATTAREPFERVLQLDPGHLPAMLHLARIAALEGNAAEVDALIRRYLESAPPGERALELRAIHALLTRDDAALRRVANELRNETDARLWMTAWRATVYSGEVEAGSELLRIMTEPDRPAQQQALGHLSLAHMELALGRLNAAAAELDRADRLVPGSALALRALFATRPFIPTEPARLRDLRAQLEGSEPPMAAGNTVMPTPDVATRPYLLGLLDLRIGDVDGARERVAILDAVDAAAHPMAPHFAVALRARIAREQGDIGEALRNATRLAERVGIPYPSGSHPLTSHLDARYLRAQLLEDAGRASDALRWYGSFLEDHPHGVIYLAPAHERSARIHAAAGRVDEARRHLERLLHLWKDADPELAPLLQDAQRDLAGLL